MKVHGVEFDLRDLFAGLMTISVIIYLFMARWFVAHTFLEQVQEQQKLRDEGFSRVMRELEQIRQVLPPPVVKEPAR